MRTKRYVITVEVSNRQTQQQIQPDQLQQAVQSVLTGEAVRQATISIAVVDDATMQALNRRHLQHDYPTDVLSFLLEQDASGLEGEVIVSAETAARECVHFGWSLEQELVLYAIHGALHLVGYDDRDPRRAEQMRERESFYLRQLGWPPQGTGAATGGACRGAALQPDSAPAAARSDSPPAGGAHSVQGDPPR